MCGFTGFIDFNNGNSNYDKILNKCNKDIAFRGPDDEKIYSDRDKGIFLSFRRLSFLDLTKYSSQPLLSHSKKSMILFNGEIYNFKYLYNQIKNYSQLPSNKLISDTQIALEYISIKGIDSFLKNYEGMLSIVYIDFIKQKIFFISDRFGQKPLYYSFQKNSLYFSSDIRTLRNNDKFKRVIKNKSIDNYLYKNCIESPNTIYENVYKMQPSSVISYDFSNNKIKKIADYKYFEIENSFTDNSSQYSLHDTITTSIEQCLQSDVKLGCFLSSGIDSTLITSIASQRLDYKINSFTLGFNETTYDESLEALNISKYLNINNEKFILNDSDIIDTFDKIPEAYSEPFSDSSQLPYLFLCSKTSNFVKGVLTGDGGDELFGGYNRHLQGVKYYKLVNQYPFLKKILNSKYFKMLFIKNTSLLNILITSITKQHYPADKIFRMISALNQNNIDDFYYHLTSHSKYNDYSTINSIFDKKTSNKHQDLEKRMMMLDLKYFLPNDLMVKSDRASMFNSLEARSPFLQKDIFQKSCSLTKEELFKNGIKKNPLKEILASYIPDKLITKRKKGFIIPIDKWLNGILKDHAFYYLSDRNIKNSPLNKDYIRNVFNSFYKKQIGCHYELWDILIFQMWFEKYH